MITESTFQVTPIETPRPRSLERYLPAAARCVLGSMFVFSGLNGFLHFMPPPSGPMPKAALAFGAALMGTGYMFPLILGTELLGGLFVLSKRGLALGLVLLAPVLVNILAFHAFLAPSGLGLAMGLCAIELYLAWRCRSAFRPLFTLRG